MTAAQTVLVWLLIGLWWGVPLGVALENARRAQSRVAP